jgi:hypothetical protein
LSTPKTKHCVLPKTGVLLDISPNKSNGKK